MKLEVFELLVLQACRDLPKDEFGNVHDDEIAQATRLSPQVVKTVLASHVGYDLVAVAPLTSGQHAAQITSQGLLKLPQPIPSPDESQNNRIKEATSVKAVPKGLRSYNQHDAEFFLELLPGPRRPDGLPESIHFWKVRIEQTETEETFRVGVIYGPSGCGKSSLVKAGLLPKLTARVRHVYVEATANRTESDLLTGIRSRYPDFSPGLGLVESLAALRNRTARPSGEKILLVLDQFEQWLLEHRGDEGTELVKALQHCDEKCEQAILMVREDFLAATIRFMKEIGVEFRPDHNACEVELFGPRHAEKVLTAFGRAEEILRDDLTTDQQKFITQSIRALARNGGLVIPVRLAIFFQTVKSQEWNSKTLRKFGDAEGVGAAFLEKTFNDEYANRRHRDHQEAAQLVLGALLPESGREIKRPSRARQELLEASGYSSQPERFDDLIRILDEELRLITAIDQDGIVVAGSPTQTTGDRFYQLTHDFLVPSLREWRSNKHQEASQLVEAIWMAETRDVPRLINQLAPLRFWANPLLRHIMESSPVDSKERLHASLALLPVDEGQVENLYPRLLKAAPTELSVLLDALKQNRERLVERLWSVLGQSEKEGPHLQAASALALYDPANSRWQSVGGKVAQAIVTVSAVDLGTWLDALRPARDKLTAPLATIFRDPERPETERSLAANILVNYASDDPALVADLLMDADTKAYAALFPIARRQSAQTLPLLRAEIEKQATSVENETDLEQVKDQRAERRARAAVALVRMGEAEIVWPLLRHSADPRLRSYLVNWMAPLGADPRTLVAELDRIVPLPKPTPAQGEQVMDAILFHPETSIRRALILALGTYGAEGLSPAEREPLISMLLDLYRNDPDAGIHGATEWTLRGWGQQDRLKERDDELMRVKDWGERRWCVNGRGQTFAVIEGPVEFAMGSPPTEPERYDDELLHKRVIPRRFAIATKGVTVEQYRQFQQASPDENDAPESDLKRYSPDDSGPMIVVTWYRAAAYCNWLSEQERIPKNELCYVPNEKGRFAEGMTIPVDVLGRRGYRLPTEAEWECACRAGSVTSRYYGHSEGLLGRYAWYLTNTRGHGTSPCGGLLPNDLGLFDLLGNVYEWCQDRFESYRLAQNNTIYDIININEYLKDTDPRLLRGGSFSYQPSVVRSADRDWVVPSIRSIYDGFRPARTYP